MPNSSNLGLPYPGLTDAPNGPTAVQSLATAVDNRLGGSWTAFTLTGAGSTNVTFGTATQDCAYKLIGNKTVVIRVLWTFGSTSSFAGTAAFGPLPFTPIARQALSGMAHRSSSAMFTVTASTLNAQIHTVAVNTTTDADGGAVGPGVPWAWTTGDTLRFTGILEIA